MLFLRIRSEKNNSSNERWFAPKRLIGIFTAQVRANYARSGLDHE